MSNKKISILDIAIGFTYQTTKSGKCTIIEIDGDYVTVQFCKTGSVVKIHKRNVHHRGPKDLFHPSVHGKGFLGGTKYSFKNHPKLYSLWQAMLQRCYDRSYLARQPTYKGCKVEKRWLNFQLFCKDILKMKNWNTPSYQMDKDGIVFGNKIYGPKFCSFIPRVLNSILPCMYATGVIKTDYGYVAQIGSKRSNIGKFPTLKEAKMAYKIALSKKLIDIVNKYKDQLHKKIVRNIQGWVVA